MSKATEKVRCNGRVWSGLCFRSCSKSGSLEHEGKHFCKLHHPPTVRAKDDAKQTAWESKWADEQAKAAAKAQEAAEQKRRADLFPELLEALKDAHPHIADDVLRERIGNLIVKAESK